MHAWQSQTTEQHEIRVCVLTILAHLVKIDGVDRFILRAFEQCSHMFQSCKVIVQYTRARMYAFKKYALIT